VLVSAIKDMSLITNYSEEALNEIAASILEIYSAEQLLILYRTFCWQNIVLPEAQNKRNDLSAELISALKSGHATALRSAAENIHHWGFGRPISVAVRESLKFWSDLEAMLAAFAENQDDEIYKCVEPLSKLLSHNGLGIATVSKWVCFVNQTRFAIFDSRVSIALRNVTFEGHRAFPVVGRRSSGGRLAWTATPLLSSSPLRTARAYMVYLQIVGRLSNTIGGMTAAQIEMALFMAGDVWPSEGEVLKPLLRGIWS
jgi:hypothetical protein